MLILRRTQMILCIQNNIIILNGIRTVSEKASVKTMQNAQTGNSDFTV